MKLFGVIWLVVSLQAASTTTQSPLTSTADAFVCPDSKTVEVDKGQTTASLVLTTPSGDVVNMRLSVGEHDFYYRLTGRPDCYFSISVKAAVEKSPAWCETKTISHVSDSNTKMSDISLSYKCAGVHLLSLPVGSYDYLYRDLDSVCSSKINVIDSRIRKRLDFVAFYNIKCDELKTSAASAFLNSVTDHMYSEIEEACSGECKRSKDYKRYITCVDDTTSVTWPTDLLLAGPTVDIPDRISNKIQPKLKSRHLLKIILYTRLPPVVYPIVFGDGLSAQLVLTTICPGALRFDALSNECLT